PMRLRYRGLLHFYGMVVNRIWKERERKIFGKAFSFLRAPPEFVRLFCGGGRRMVVQNTMKDDLGFALMERFESEPSLHIQNIRKLRRIGKEYWSSNDLPYQQRKFASSDTDFVGASLFGQRLGQLGRMGLLGQISRSSPAFTHQQQLGRMGLLGQISRSSPAFAHQQQLGRMGFLGQFSRTIALLNPKKSILCENILRLLATWKRLRYFCETENISLSNWLQGIDMFPGGFTPKTGIRVKGILHRFYRCRLFGFT
ncbi:MAG: hypothetical protein ACI4QT_03450, partial [Kiritimatiellia bacterium]